MFQPSAFSRRRFRVLQSTGRDASGQLEPRSPERQSQSRPRGAHATLRQPIIPRSVCSRLVRFKRARLLAPRTGPRSNGLETVPAPCGVIVIVSLGICAVRRSSRARAAARQLADFAEGAAPGAAIQWNDRDKRVARERHRSLCITNRTGVKVRARRRLFNRLRADLRCLDESYLYLLCLCAGIVALAAMSD